MELITKEQLLLETNVELVERLLAVENCLVAVGFPGVDPLEVIQTSMDIIRNGPTRDKGGES